MGKEVDNFKAVYGILSRLEKMMDLPEVNVDLIGYEAIGVSEERWKKYILMMHNVGYVSGVYAEKYVTGVKVDVSQIAITLKGLEYLQENSLMQRVYRNAKGISDLIP